MQIIILWRTQLCIYLFLFCNVLVPVEETVDASLPILSVGVELVSTKWHAAGSDATGPYDEKCEGGKQHCHLTWRGLLASLADLAVMRM